VCQRCVVQRTHRRRGGALCPPIVRRTIASLPTRHFAGPTAVQPTRLWSSGPREGTGHLPDADGVAQRHGGRNRGLSAVGGRRLGVALSRPRPRRPAAGCAVGLACHQVSLSKGVRYDPTRHYIIGVVFMSLIRTPQRRRMTCACCPRNVTRRLCKRTLSADFMPPDFSTSGTIVVGESET